MDGWRGAPAMGPPSRSGAVDRGSIVRFRAVAGERPGDPHLGLAVGVAVAHSHDESAAGAIERCRHVAQAHSPRIELHERAAVMARRLRCPAIRFPALYERARSTAVHPDINATRDISVTCLIERPNRRGSKGMDAWDS
jgi:hypothetical protein